MSDELVVLVVAPSVVSAGIECVWQTGLSDNTCQHIKYRYLLYVEILFARLLSCNFRVSGLIPQT